MAIIPPEDGVSREFENADDIEWVEVSVQRRDVSPIQVEDQGLIQSLLGRFHEGAPPRADGIQLGVAEARIVIRFMDGQESIYIVAFDRWYGPHGYTGHFDDHINDVMTELDPEYSAPAVRNEWSGVQGRGTE